MKEHPASIAKFHAGLIIQSALDCGWEPPDKYSPLKRARIVNRVQAIASSLLRVPNNEGQRHEARAQ